MKHIFSKFALFSLFLSSYQTFGFNGARKPFLFGPMQPADSCSAPMRPVGQFEFETPVLEDEKPSWLVVRLRFFET